MTDRSELERQIAELQAKLAALDAEPLAKVVERHLEWLNNLPVPTTGCTAQMIKLQDALRRGMELAPRAPMDDAAVGWLRKHIAEVDDDNTYWGGPHKREYLTAPEILERIATLSRVPAAAAWPGEESSGYERGEWRNGVWHDQTGGAQ
jgi:hypothetical protein